MQTAPAYSVPTQLWATPEKPHAVDAALACASHALVETGLCPGAEDDWDLGLAASHLRQAIEHLQSWQQAQGE
jgi:hypothetical protein